MVTVINAVNLLADYACTDFLADRGETAGDGDNRTIVDLLVAPVKTNEKGRHRCRPFCFIPQPLSGKR